MTEAGQYAALSSHCDGAGRSEARASLPPAVCRGFRLHASAGQPIIDFQPPLSSPSRIEFMADIARIDSQSARSRSLILCAIEAYGCVL